MNPRRAIVPVIMSGGSGQRLWPLSTEARPKQFHPLAGARSLFLDAATRLMATSPKVDDGLDISAPIVVCNRAHVARVREALAEAGIEPLAVVVEPFGRNTAAVAVCAARLAQTLAPPGARVLLAPADHRVADPKALRAAVARAAQIDDRIVAFGVAPTSPETGYGYIQRGEALSPGVHAVARFVEKPRRETAEAYLADGGYDWNSGMLLYAPQTLLAEMAAHRPDIASTALAAVDAARREGALTILDDDLFAAVPAVSVDVAVMERTGRAAVVPCDIGWADIGSWSEIWRLGEKDEAANLLHGSVATLDTEGSLVWADDGVDVGAIGLKDMVVAATPHAVLVAPRSRAQEVRALALRLMRPLP